MGQDVNPPPSISISDYKLEVVHGFVFLGSFSELNRRIGKVIANMSRLKKRVLTNVKLTEYTSPGLQGFTWWTRSSVAASHGLCSTRMPQCNSMPFACVSSIASCASPDRTKSLTAPTLREQGSLPCSAFSSQDACNGLVMLIEWMMGTFHWISWKASCYKEHDQQANPKWGTKMFAKEISRPSESTLTLGKLPTQTYLSGDWLCWKASTTSRRPLISSYGGRLGDKLSILLQSSPIGSAAETPPPKLDFWITTDAAPVTLIWLDPWSPETAG